MSSEPHDRYDTMIDHSLETGQDDFGKYSSADFQYEDAYLTVLKRPEGYSIQWQTERPLTDVFSSLTAEYQPSELINGFDSDGQSYLIDPDAWNGFAQELILAEIPYSEFRVEWRPFEVLTEEDEKRFSELILTSSADQFDVERPHFTPAWKLHPLLSDESVDNSASRKVFNDIRFYLEDSL